MQDFQSATLMRDVRQRIESGEAVPVDVLETASENFYKMFKEWAQAGRRRVQEEIGKVQRAG